MLLRLGLEIADRIASALPASVAYRLADIAGDAWRHFAPGRRRLVAANLRRVCAATGRPTSGPDFAALVRAAFRNHARYYLELLRTPHYRPERIDEYVTVPRWAELEPILRGRPTVIVTGHLGNFEPFGAFLAAHGMRPLAPIEEIRPEALYRFLADRRGAGQVDLVPVRRARRALARRLADGGMVGIVGDRDLTGSGQPVEVFGHPVPIPTGAAALALMTGAVLVAGRCLRVGPDRFEADGDPIELTPSGDRRADLEALTVAVAARFERDIGDAPEQWWGAFQPFWPDLDPARVNAPR